MHDQALTIIGERMRAQRRKLDLSLEELAAQTNLSKSFLSQVERGITSPSIDSLGLIARALEIPMFLFFVGEDSPQVVRRHSERRLLRMPDSDLRYEFIWFDAHRKMEVLVGRLQPGEASSRAPRGHTAGDMVTVDECVYVLEGCVDFQLGEDVHRLEPGDSAYFSGNLPHRFSAFGDHEAVLLFAIAPPAVSR